MIISGVMGVIFFRRKKVNIQDIYVTETI
jgi:hypothetical protein